MNIKLIAIASLLGISGVVHADTWAVKNVYVTDIRVMYGGSSVLRVEYETNPNSVISTAINCAANTTPVNGYANRFQASYTASGLPNSLLSSMQKTLATAQAHDVPVDLFMDLGSNCRMSDDTYGTGGIGRQLNGVRFSTAE